MDLTTRKAARRYLEELAGAGIGAQTLEQYRHIFRAHIFGSDLAGVPLRDLSDGHIKLWLGRLKEKTIGSKKRPIQPSTVNMILARVRTIVILAWRRGEIGRPVNRMDLVDNLPMRGREPDPFSPEELLALLGADSAGIAAGGERHQGGRPLPRARDQRGDHIWKKKYSGLGLSELRELETLT